MKAREKNVEAGNDAGVSDALLAEGVLLDALHLAFRRMLRMQAALGMDSSLPAWRNWLRLISVLPS
mgnify:CR=1 FL=1